MTWQSGRDPSKSKKKNSEKKPLKLPKLKKLRATPDPKAKKTIREKAKEVLGLDIPRKLNSECLQSDYEYTSLKGDENPDENTINRARQLYMHFVDLLYICRDTGISLGKLRYLVYQKPYFFEGKTYKGWVEQREEIEKEVHREAKTSLRNAAYQGTEMGFALILRSLQQWVDGEVTPELKEAKDLAAIVKTLHSVTVQEEAKEDKHQEYAPKDILDALANDPFLLEGIKAQKRLETASRYLSEEEDEK